jgi:hypothetical protein
LSGRVRSVSRTIFAGHASLLKITPAKYALIRHLLRPARGGAAAVLIVFAMLLAIASKAGLIRGLVMTVFLASWFFKYAYVLFDHTVRGFDEPPVLDVDMLNPLNEQRPFAQVVILVLIYFAVTYVKHALGSAVASIVAVAAILLAPASVAVLGLESNVIKAANPVAWVRMVLGLGPMYLLVLIVIAGYGLLIAFMAHWELWLSVQIATFLFGVLSVFSVLGGALYERRHELGLEAWASPELIEERRKAQELRQSEYEVTAAYGQMRAGSHTQAWETLQTWLSSRAHAPDDYRWLCGRVALWGDPRYVTRLTEEYVDRLLALKRNGEALDVVAARLTEDPGFRPKSAVATLQIARFAAGGGGKPPVARALLADFSTRFAGDRCVPAASALARELAP